MGNESEANLIGVFDSGIGGLSIVRAIKTILPQQPILYIADQEHVPYGEKRMQDIRAYADGISSYLISKGASLMVVACNTASAAALNYLREKHPQRPFVGMEPAIKPASLETQTGAIGVLATPATFQGEPYQKLVDRFGKDVQILTDTCPGLVMQIEHGNLNGSATRRILENAILPMLNQEIDTLVLGCTHYPFVIPLIREICGAAIHIIDPAPSVAKRVAFLLSQQKKREKYLVSETQFAAATTNDPEKLRHSIQNLLDERIMVYKLKWMDNTLTEA